MKKMQEAIVAVLIVLIVQAVGTSAQTLINGDFELPEWTYREGTGNDTVVYLGVSSDSANLQGRGYTTCWAHLPTGSSYLPGWKVGGNGIYHFVSNRPWFEFGTSGNCCVNLYKLAASGDYRGGSISQYITDLKPGTQYYIYFDLWQPSLGNNTILTVQINSESFPVLNSTFGKWQTHAIPFIATDTSASLTFSTPEQAAQNIYLDNVRVSAVQNAPVVLSAKPAMGIKVEGKQGMTYRVEYADSINPSQWFFLTRVTVTNSPTWVYDEILPQDARRIYRSVQQ